MAPMLNYGATAVALQDYGQGIQVVRAHGKAAAHSYRLLLQRLLGRLGGALHEPQQVACGAPERVVDHAGIPIGYVECKDLHMSLDQVEASEQLTRYRRNLRNLILTNHLEFRWYLDGQRRQKVCMGEVDEDDGIRLDPNAFPGMYALLQGFLGAAPGAIHGAEQLAQAMAAKARLLRDTVAWILGQENSKGPFHKLWQVYRQMFTTDLSAAGFADLQAQTTTYGLFTARCSHLAGVPFTRQSAVFATTTPFLQDLFGTITGAGIDQSVTWIVDDLAYLLDQADMVAVLKDFRQRSQRQDPIVYFYENFLKVYDPKLKEIRGIYYTPESVVSYIVRSIDCLLKRQFKLSSGLAEMPRSGESHRVLILDPAAGTGTFLREVIVQIRAALEQQGLAGIWPDYVKRHLLPRLFGFELLMAPYAVGHLKLALELGDGQQGLRLGPDQRLNVFLTNTLEGTSANGIQQGNTMMVVLGNPPYSGHSANKNPWINQLLRGRDDDGSRGSYFHVDGQPLRERNMKWLNDDYVKFIRFAQWRIEKTGEGILAFVTNHSYLESPTFRAMRRSLMETFDQIYVLDLHGNSRRREKAPDGSKDVNVFDIQQGVAIGFFVKQAKSSPGTAKTVFWAERWGERDTGPQGGKYGWLAANDVETTPWRPLTPQAPAYLFVPRDEITARENENGWIITDIFLEHSVGIATARDKLSIQSSIDEIRRVVNHFSSLTVDEARQFYNLGKDTRDWSVERAQRDLKSHPAQDQHITAILYRPFDQRFTYYTGRGCGFICKPRRKIMRHMLKGANVALCIGRAGQATGSTQWDVVLIADKPTDLNIFRRGGHCLFPLYRYWPDKKEHNLNPDFIKASATALNLKFVPDGSGDLLTSFGPEDVLHSIYALLHSPAYRQRYQDHLKSDFPILPLINSRGLFAALVRLGQYLVALHRLKTEGYEAPEFPYHGSNSVEVISYSAPRNNHPGQVWINSKQCFHGVAPPTWTFSIGGYVPAQKWLKDRKGHRLSLADVHHYRRICTALATTAHLMARIDDTIDAHGGWPLGARHPVP